MWVHATDTGAWKLWLVPPPECTKDKHEFYRRVAHVISKNRAVLGGLDAGDIEMVPESHPAVRGLKVMELAGLNSVAFSSNLINGFYLPDGIALRIAFPKEEKKKERKQAQSAKRGKARKA